MGTAERKEREKEKRRCEIILAAEKVFFSKGLEKSTMDDVAEIAELSKGTLYLYFENKEELLNEIAVRGVQILEEYFQKAIRNKKNGIDKVRAIGKAFIKFFKEHNEYHEAMLYTHSKKNGTKASGKISDISNYKSNSVFVNSILDGIKDGTIRNDINPVEMSFLLWGHTMGILQLISSKDKIIEKLTGKKSEKLLEISLDFNTDALRPR